MPEELTKFVAVFAEWTGPECRLVTIEFHIEDERDALEIAEDMALLEGTELIYLSKSKGAIGVDRYCLMPLIDATIVRLEGIVV